MIARVDELFGEALDRQADERMTWLQQQCDGDPVLLAAVLRLLQADAANGLLDQQMIELAAPLVQAAPIHDADDPRLGRHYGPYALVRVLGRGGMGTVYEARRSDGGFDQSVALKLPTRGLDDAVALRRFEQERQILVRLRHPNIAGFLDGGVSDEGQPWYALELVDGMTLDRWAVLAPELPRRLRGFLQICGAVQHAHQNLVLHRDLKPGNILVGRDGQVKLLDFGIAKLLDDELGDEGTRTVQRIFSLEYAAPEQIAGATAATTGDIYSLGVVLYELLCGERPFKRGATMRTMHQVSVDDAVPPSRVLARRPEERRRASQLRGDLDTIVLKCLDQDPARRYASVAGLQRDVERHLDGLPIDARPDTLAYRLGKFVARHRIGTALAVTAVLALMAATLVSLQQTRIAQAERDIALAEARHQEALTEHFSAVLNRAVAAGDPLTIAQLLRWAGDPGLLGDFGDARMQRTVALAVSDLLVQNNDYPAALKLLERLVPELSDAGPRDRLQAMSNRAIAQLRSGALDAAAQSLDQAEALLPIGDRGLMAAQLRNYRSQLLRARGQFDEAALAARESGEWAAATHDGSPLSRGEVIGGSANALLLMGDLDGAIDMADTALAVWRDARVSQNASMPTVAAVAANARLLRGDIRAALAQLDALADHTGPAESGPPRSARDASRAKAMAVLGRSEEALALSEQATRTMCRAVGEESLDCLRMQISQIDTSRTAGDLAGAARLLAAVQARLRRQPNPPLQASIERFAQLLAVQADPQPAALDALMAVMKAASQPGIAQRNVVRGLLVLTEQLNAAGHGAAAARCAAEAIELARGLDEHSGMDQALLRLWQARLRGAPVPAEAVVALAAALGEDHPWVAAHRRP